MTRPANPPRRYFVTGTDTGVGKTFVTCALARRARAQGSELGHADEEDARQDALRAVGRRGGRQVLVEEGQRWCDDRVDVVEAPAAVVVARQLDQAGSGYRELIERELAMRLGRPATESERAREADASGETLPEPASARGARAVQALQCVNCRTLNDLDARFCKQCGHPFQ